LLKKDARKKAHECDKALLGYDPKKWQRADAKIRNEGEERYTYVGCTGSRATKGLYRDIHKFLANRSWTPTAEQSTISGITWPEPFVLLDVSGARTAKGDHVKDAKARKRADARNKNRIKQQGSRTRIGNALVQPTLDEELKRFKAIVRHIAKHEVDSDQGRWFLMETIARHRRLGALAVWGNQPAMAAHL